MVSDAGAFDTPVGVTVCLRFNATGTYSYHCSIHPTMVGAVTVR